MKTTLRFSLATLALCCSGAVSAVLAADVPTCANVVLSPEFLKAYPAAPAACQGVMSKNGVTKIHYKATVTDTGKGGVILTFLNAYKQPVTNGRPLKFTPGPDLNVSANGKKVRASDLKKGDVLDFWVPEKMVGFNPEPESTELVIFIID